MSFVAALTIGNVLPLNKMPEGTVVSNVEEKEGDRGTLARTSGTYATIVGHSDDGSKTRIRLPSGARKTINGRARAMVGIVAGKSSSPLQRGPRVAYGEP